MIARVGKSLKLNVLNHDLYVVKNTFAGVFVFRQLCKVPLEKLLPNLVTLFQVNET